MKKTVSKLVLYLICSILLISPVLAKVRTGKKDKPGTAIFVMCESPCILATTKRIAKDLPILYLDIKVPQLHGFSDKKFEKKLNKMLLQTGDEKAATALSNATTYNKGNIEDNLPALKFEYLSSYTLIETANPYFVIEFLDYEYSGGAHGLSTQTYLNINTATNTVLALEDLFKPNSTYQTIINDEINRQIGVRMTQGEFFFTGTDGFSGIKATQPFYINQSGDLVIVFNVYEIAPYVAGAIEFIIPQTLLKDTLK